jgi:hypothetical protein
VFEGASLEFTVDNIFKAGHYEIVIRYEHMQATDPWQDVRITVVRHDGPPDISDVCADYAPGDDYKQASLPASM